MLKALHRKYKQMIAFMLIFVMTFTNVGSNLTVAFAAGETEEALFLVEGSELRGAIQDAMEEGEIFKFSSLELKANRKTLKTSYEKLLGTKSGKVYKLDIDVDDSYAPDDVSVEVFYNDGTEHVVFLFINESDMVVTFRVNVDGYETNPVTINPNSVNVENGAEESFAEDYSSVTMIDDEPEKLGAVLIPSEETESVVMEEPETDNVAEIAESQEADEEMEAIETESEEVLTTEEDVDIPEESELETEEDSSLGGMAEAEAEVETEAEVEVEVETEAKESTLEDEETVVEVLGMSWHLVHRVADPLEIQEESEEIQIEEEELLAESETESAEEETDFEEESDAETEPVENEEAELESEGVETREGEIEIESESEEAVEAEIIVEESTEKDETENADQLPTESIAEEMMEEEETAIEKDDNETASSSDAEKEYPEEDGQMLIDDVNSDDIYQVLGDLEGKSFNTVTIWSCANARAYSVSLENLEGVESFGNYNVDYSVEPLGAADIYGSKSIVAGGDLYFGVTPQIGYEIVDVTANGIELEAVGETALASASDLAEYEYIYVAESVAEDLEIVVNLQENVGMTHPEFRESVEINGVTVSAFAEEGILPEGTTLSVEEVTEQVGDLVKEKLETEDNASVNEVIAYDINLMYQGMKLDNSWSEQGYVSISFSGERIVKASEAAETVEVLHVVTPTETVTAVDAKSTLETETVTVEAEAPVLEELQAEDIELDAENRTAVDVKEEAVDEVTIKAEHFSIYTLVFGSGSSYKLEVLTKTEKSVLGGDVQTLELRDGTPQVVGDIADQISKKGGETKPEFAEVNFGRAYVKTNLDDDEDLETAEISSIGVNNGKIQCMLADEEQTVWNQTWIDAADKEITFEFSVGGNYIIFDANGGKFNGEAVQKKVALTSYKDGTTTKYKLANVTDWNSLGEPTKDGAKLLMWVYRNSDWSVDGNGYYTGTSTLQPGRVVRAIYKTDNVDELETAMYPTYDAETGKYEYPEIDGEPQGAVNAVKRATWKDYDKGIAEITLEVSGVPVRKGSDVVIVLDRSGSMSPRLTDDASREERMFKAKEACLKVVDIMLQNETNNNRVAFIPFSANDSKTSGHLEGRVNFQTTANKELLKKAINAVDAYGGTSYKDPLEKAAAYINDSDRNPVVGEKTITRDAYVIFISDGHPENDKKDGIITDLHSEITDELKKNGVTIYTVGIQMTNAEYIKTLEDISSGKDYYRQISEVSELVPVLESIAQDINYAGTNATFGDVISGDFELLEESEQEWYNTEAASQYTFDGKNVTINVGNITEQKKTYSIRIQMPDAPEGNRDTPGSYFTNNDVTLTYTDYMQDNAIKYKEEIGHPALPRDCGAIQIKYYQVNSEGEYINDRNVVVNESLKSNAIVGDTITKESLKALYDNTTRYNVHAESGTDNRDNFNLYGNIPTGYKLWTGAGNESPKNINLKFNTTETVEFKVIREELSVSGTKNWEGMVAGEDYPEITIRLFRDDVEVDSVILKGGATKYEFTNLPKCAVGYIEGYNEEYDKHEFKYTVSEDPVPGYTSVQNGTDFVNTANTTSVTVEKVWLDGDRLPLEDQFIPEELTVKLMRATESNAYREYTLSSDSNWKYEFTGLPTHAPDGTAYSYYVKEEVPEGFTADSSEVQPTAGVATFSNSRNGESPKDPVKSHRIVDIFVEGTEQMVKIGGKIVYTISWYNHHNKKMNVSVADKLQNGLQFVPEESTSTGLTVNGQKLTWDLGSVAPFTGGEITVTAIVTEDVVTTADPVVLNRASVVIGEHEQQTNEDRITVANPDWTVTKLVRGATGGLDAVGEEKAKVGDNLTYVIEIKNTGNVTITEPVTDTFTVDGKETALTLTLASESNASYVDGKITLGVGGSATLEALYTVTATDTLLKNVVIVGDPTDPDSPKDEVKTEVEPNVALTVDKEVSGMTGPSGKARTGDTLLYTITVSNTGNIVFSKPIVDTFTVDGTEKTLTLTLADGSPGRYINGILTLNKGDTAILNAEYKVRSADDRLINTVIIGDPNDPNSPKDEVTTDVYHSSGGSGGSSGGGGGGGTSGGPGSPATTPIVPIMNILDSEVPLGTLPKTGRNNAGAILLILSSSVFAAFAKFAKKKEEKE